MQAIFDRLLVATDLESPTDLLLERVMRLCGGRTDCVHIVHVVRSGMHYLSDRADKNLDNVDLRYLRDHATVQLNALLRRNGFQIAPQHIHIRHGEPATEIKKLAHELQVDLVIVGSHCKDGGWVNLPGATTNCVLQGIDRDVMAIHV